MASLAWQSLIDIFFSYLQKHSHATFTHVEHAEGPPFGIPIVANHELTLDMSHHNPTDCTPNLDW